MVEDQECMRVQARLIIKINNEMLLYVGLPRIHKDDKPKLDPLEC